MTTMTDIKMVSKHDLIKMIQGADINTDKTPNVEYPYGESVEFMKRKTYNHSAYDMLEVYYLGYYGLSSSPYDYAGNKLPVFYNIKPASFGDYDNSCQVERSNYAYLEENFKWLDTRNGGHHSQFIGIIDNDEMIDYDEAIELIDLLESLADCPVLDEGLLYRFEGEAENEAWDNWARSDVIREINKIYDSEDVTEYFEDLDSDDLFYEFIMAGGQIGEYAEHESGGNVYFRIEKIVPALISRIEKQDNINFSNMAKQERQREIDEMSEKQYSKVVSIGKAAAAKLRFIMRALSKDYGRQALQFIKVTDDYLVSTDGFRLHVTPNDMLKEKDDIGLVRIDDWKLPKLSGEIKELSWDNNLNFPNWQAIIPNDNDDHTDIVLDTKYLKDILADAGDEVRIRIYQESRPVELFTTDKNDDKPLYAIIMPKDYLNSPDHLNWRPTDKSNE